MKKRLFYNYIVVLRYIMDSLSKEQIINQISTILKHKKTIIDVSEKMAQHLIENGETDLALNLVRRAVVHDNSKLEEEEFLLLSIFKSRRDALKNPYLNPNKKEKQFLDVHWEKNSHHPEYWDNISDMGELDIIEMVCDWYSRSLECNTDIEEFIKVRQKNRFNFPEEIYNKILKYHEILESQSDAPHG